jgi:sugar/nucleoside kinase (ribokinase family)
MKTVVAAGHICLDITPIFGSGAVCNINDILKPGRLVQMNGINIHTGGSVANTGLSLMKLGNNVKLLGKIGTDEFGQLVLSILKQEGYEHTSDMIISPGSTTSYSVVLAIPGIDRIFLHDPGANDTFCYDDIDFDAVRDASLFHFGYPPIMKRMYADSGSELVHIFRTAKGCDMQTSLDLAAVDPDSEAGHADWCRILGNVLPFTDYFVPSFEELCFMIDRDRYNALSASSGDGDILSDIDINKDIIPLALSVMKMGAQVVMIKCGSKGIYYRSRTEDGFVKSYRPSKVVSATGAGDTSIAAFLTAMLNGYSLPDSVKLAAAEGASCVEAVDALSGIRPLDELEQKIRAGWEQN